jgi:hypothetical protein
LQIRGNKSRRDCIDSSSIYRPSRFLPLLRRLREKLNDLSGAIIDDFLCFLLADGGLGAGTITSRWPPVGAGPTLGPADTNGAGIDAKHLDVGDMSDVSDVSRQAFPRNLPESSSTILLPSNRMKKISRPPMPKEYGVPTSNRVFKKLSPSTHRADDEKSFYRKRARCMVSTSKARQNIFQLNVEVQIERERKLRANKQ